MKKIKLFDPIIGKEESRSIQNVLESGYWASGSGVGYVNTFEKRFKKYVNCKECVAVNSGTAALHLALSESNIEKREVILPSLTFISTAHSIMYNNGIPVFADIDPETLCIDPYDVSKKISKKTKAILPVHFAGFSANLLDLKKLSDKNNLQIIEDAAHACGSRFNHENIGSHSNFVCFSFQPVKNLAMPSGGLIAINQRNSKSIKKELNSKRWCGIADRKGVNYDIKNLGWNFYMNEFSAAIGLVQLKKLDKLNNIRKKNAKLYSKEINISTKMPYNHDASYHFFWILVKNRRFFRKKMLENGIETGIHYKPIHKMSFYKNRTSLPNTEKICEQLVSLPIHPNLTENNLDRIISNVNKYA